MNSLLVVSIRILVSMREMNQEVQAPICACTELLWFVRPPQQDLMQIAHCVSNDAELHVAHLSALATHLGPLKIPV